MAGDWIKMRTHLGSERATMVICDMTGLDEFAVVGRLHAIWVWAGEHTVTGDVTGVTLKTINRIVRCENFGEAMKAAGWLEIIPEGGLRFPRWKRHNSKAAKERALAAARQAKHRHKRPLRNRYGERDMTVTSNGPRAEAEAEKSSADAATALCMDRGVQGGKDLQAPPDFVSTLNTMMGILAVDDPDQIGFLARLAYAHSIGFAFPVPVWDYIGRAKSTRRKRITNPAGYLTEAIRSDLGPERWSNFERTIPPAARCQAMLAMSGGNRDA